MSRERDSELWTAGYQAAMRDAANVVRFILPMGSAANAAIRDGLLAVGVGRDYAPPTPKDRTHDR